MKLKFHLSMVLLSLMFLSFSVDDTNTVYVYSEQLNPQNYKQLKLACSDNETIAFETACVPAGVIKIMFSGDLNTMESDLKTFFEESANVVELEILNDYSEDEFLQKCSNSRIGR